LGVKGRDNNGIATWVQRNSTVSQIEESSELSYLGRPSSAASHVPMQDVKVIRAPDIRARNEKCFPFCATSVMAAKKKKACCFSEPREVTERRRVQTHTFFPHGFAFGDH
jgi:hypothetical protein